jgi:uncharacterized protein (DUF433 family)
MAAPKLETVDTLENHATNKTLVTEIYGGRDYVYLPLGEYIVAAPGICGGRPTIKYHRLDARYVIGYLRLGETREDIAANFKIPLAAVDEAVALADVYDYERSYA